MAKSAIYNVLLIQQFGQISTKNSNSQPYFWACTSAEFSVQPS